MRCHEGCGTLAVIAVLALSGCNIGPKYQAPVVSAPPAVRESSPAAYSNTLPGAWQPARPQDAEPKRANGGKSSMSRNSTRSKIN